jgi:hypothetical protein
MSTQLQRGLILLGFAFLLATSTGADIAAADRSGPLVASRVITPKGGTVRAGGGVSIFVPAGRMRRPGRVTITEVHHHVYDFHIHAPWRGSVAVTLPLSGDRRNAVVHRVGELWMAEGTDLGQRTVWVHQLSWFTDAITKAGSKIAGSLCLSFNMRSVLECVAKKGLKYVDGRLASWIFSHVPASCQARLAYAGVTAARGGPWAVFFAILITENLDGLCTPHVGETGYHPPTTPAPTSPPPATTPPPPAPSSPQPSQPPGRYETTGGPTHTWTNYTNAGGYEGPTIAAYQTVLIACKVTGFRVADGNTWWYRIASSPWNNAYYASADAFYNNGQTSGSLKGTPFVDPAVPDC